MRDKFHKNVYQSLIIFVLAKYLAEGSSNNEYASFQRFRRWVQGPTKGYRRATLMSITMCRTVATLISHRVSSSDGFPFQDTGKYPAFPYMRGSSLSWPPFTNLNHCPSNKPYPRNRKLLLWYRAKKKSLRCYRTSMRGHLPMELFAGSFRYLNLFFSQQLLPKPEIPRQPRPLSNCAM